MRATAVGDEENQMLVMRATAVEDEEKSEVGT
jgi:hypothetical protein